MDFFYNMETQNVSFLVACDGLLNHLLTINKAISYTF